MPPSVSDTRYSGFSIFVVQIPSPIFHIVTPIIDTVIVKLLLIHVPPSLLSYDIFTLIAKPTGYGDAGGLWWRRRVMAKPTGYGDAGGLWRRRRVLVTPAGYGDAGGLWWCRQVMAKPTGYGDAGEFWWRRRVMVTPAGYGEADGLWWRRRVMVTPTGWVLLLPPVMAATPRHM